MRDDLKRAKIVITNYHAFKLRERIGLSKGGRQLLQGRGGEELNTQETEGQMIQRVMPDLMGMKKILVIGSLGYIGSRLTDYLMKYGYDCVGADVGFFQYGVLYHSKHVPMLDRDARTLTEQDLETFDIVEVFIVEVCIILRYCGY